MFRRLLKWTLCLLGLVTTSSTAPYDATADFGGESGSGMLYTGKTGVTPVKPEVSHQFWINGLLPIRTEFFVLFCFVLFFKVRHIRKRFLSCECQFTLKLSKLKFQPQFVIEFIWVNIYRRHFNTNRLKLAHRLCFEVKCLAHQISSSFCNPH